MSSLLRESRAFFIAGCATCLLMCNCFFAPTPKNVRMSGWEPPKLRRHILNSRDLGDIYLAYGSLSLRMRKLDPRPQQKFEHEWQEALRTFKDVHEKASRGWPGLTMDRQLAEDLGVAGNTPEQAVLALTYQRLAAAIGWGNPFKDEFITYYGSIRPQDAWLLSKWMEYHPRPSRIED